MADDGWRNYSGNSTIRHLPSIILHPSLHRDPHHPPIVERVRRGALHEDDDVVHARREAGDVLAQKRRLGSLPPVRTGIAMAATLFFMSGGIAIGLTDVFWTQVALNERLRSAMAGSCKGNTAEMPE